MSEAAIATEAASTEGESQVHRKTPRFNHIAISVSPDLLGEEGRADLLAFYGEVFGWVELPTMTEDRRRLVMSAYTYDQFVYLHADKSGMVAPKGDHWGMGVSTQEEFDDYYARCQAFREKDDRVEIITPHVDDYGVLKLHGFYVRFLLPLMVEVQRFEWQPGVDFNGQGG